MTVNRTLSRDMSALQKKLREISDRYRVDIIYSFGSRAHEVRDFLNGQGEWDKSITSDVDLGVKAAPDMASMSVREKVGLTADLEDLLGSKPERTRSHRPEPSGAPKKTGAASPCSVSRPKWLSTWTEKRPAPSPCGQGRRKQGLTC